MPPLALTGERTLPDVPEENYWFRRHLVVYEWIAARCAGLDVVDMACGEGYGTDVLARRAARGHGRGRQSRGPRARPARYTRPGVRFERDLVETLPPEPCDAVVFLQTIEHVEDPEEVLDALPLDAAPGGAAYVSTPNVLTLAPQGAESPDNPWHVQRVPGGGVPRALRSGVRARGDARALPRPQAARARAGAPCRLGLACTRALGITKPFYDWFTPAIAARDFALRTARSTARSTS